jgi:hypothetical protein
MSTTSSVLRNIATYCAAAGIAETTFGKRFLNDGKFVPRLRAGGTMTLKTLDKVHEVLAGLPKQILSTHDSEKSEFSAEKTESCTEISELFTETRKEVS